MTLTESLHNNRRIVYTDNFYTSLELFIDLIVIRYICKWHSSYAPTKNTFSLYNNTTKTYLGELNVTYSVIGQSTPVVPVKFDINVNMLQQPPGTPLKRMSENALYHLREQHPVIDAVAVFLGSDATKWLLLIQISLCKYSSHSSKAGDLKKQVVGAEKNTTDKSVDWLQYYNDMVPQAQKCMYVYLSPNETGNPIKSLCIDLDVVHSFPYCCFYIYFSFGNARPGPKTHSSGAQASVITKKNWLCQPKISIGF